MWCIQESGLEPLHTSVPTHWCRPGTRETWSQRSRHSTTPGRLLGIAGVLAHGYSCHRRDGRRCTSGTRAARDGTRPLRTDPGRPERVRSAWDPRSLPSRAFLVSLSPIRRHTEIRTGVLRFLVFFDLSFYEILVQNEKILYIYKYSLGKGK